MSCKRIRPIDQAAHSKAHPRWLDGVEWEVVFRRRASVGLKQLCLDVGLLPFRRRGPEVQPTGPDPNIWSPRKTGGQ